MAVGPAAADAEVRRNARVLILPAAVVLLLGVVALASRAPLRPPRATPLGTPAVGQGQPVSPWSLALVGLGAAAMLGSLALNLIWTRRRDSFPRRKGSMLLQLALLSLLLLGGVLAVGGLRGRRGAALPARLSHRALTGTTRPPSVSFHFPLWAQLSVAVLVLAAGVLAASAFGRRWRATDVPTVPALAPKITYAIDRSLEDLEADPDARRAIIAAYRRMEESLAHVGLPRGPSETAREYLSRGLASLELSPSTIGTLTTLFERAKFSLHHVDLRLRDEAVSALRALQEELAGA
jgi:hypothetical protein